MTVPTDEPVPDVGIVVPTRNSAATLEDCLISLRRQSRRCAVVVVDNFSTDATVAIAERHADAVISRGPERSAQRNVGAEALSTPIIGFVDSDMILGRRVVEEVWRALDDRTGAAIIPERTVGIGYWSRVRAFERSFYAGCDGAEAARFFTRPVFRSALGFDETLDAGEDWDLTIRARQLTTVTRIHAVIDHQEGRVSYRRACAKKASYAAGIRAFGHKHGTGALLGALDRPYLRRPWKLAVPHPLLGLGVVALKVGEAAAVAAALASGAASPGARPDDRCSTTAPPTGTPQTGDRQESGS
jgi:glycosyltransferase involved in cell wall biosynthesis